MSSQDGDLFGPDPGADPLAYYDAGGRDGDAYLAADPAVGGAWRRFVAGLITQGNGDLSRIRGFLDRHVDELGLAFRLTGDVQERAWPLSPIPILISAAEWGGVEAGLIQRAELLEAVLQDMYGDQALFAGGHLPPAMASGSPHFARRMMGMKPPGGHYLRQYAVDLARGPDGTWRVLADRTRLSIGVGYALENRLALSRATGSLLGSIGARRQSDFFDALRDGIAADCVRSDPRIALFTPGRFNQSYPEQALLARHLGFSLVEGRDLVVRNSRLFVRTIAGMKRIDALWRWINTRDIDPLNFDSRSRIGVPDLLQVCASGEMLLCNWPGAGAVESRAMSAFMPRLSQYLRGEALLLPNAATWWCGGEEERDYVAANLDQLVISSAFRQPNALLPDSSTRVGATLSPAERDLFLQELERRPMDYAAQEVVRLSTTPCLDDGRIAPRGFTIRAFLTRGVDGQWVVLPGGLGRMSGDGDLRTSLIGEGDISCDVCVLDAPGSEQAVPVPVLVPPQVRRAQGLLPSQAADNLFWLGRYVERSHQVARVVRTMLDAGDVLQGDTGMSTAASRLAQLLERWVAIPKATSGWTLASIAGTALGSADQPGSVVTLDGRIRGLARLLRDRLSRDSWRALNRPLPRWVKGDSETIAAAADQQLEQSAAFVRLTADTMSRSAAWRFFDLGMSLERASLMTQACRVIVPGRANAMDLAALLDLADAQAVYRARYLTMPFIAPVLDMVLLDPAQPRSLVYQLRRISQHLEMLPSLREDGMAELPLRLARQLFVRVESLDADMLTPQVMDELQQALADLSNAISKRFFLEEVTTPTRDGAQLLS